jgi:hypothetical protein
MPVVEWPLLALTFLGVFGGSWGIYWTRNGADSTTLWWGRWLVLSFFLLLDFTCLIAALFWAEGLVAVGLSAGLLVVAMLWETPKVDSPPDLSLPE